MLELMPWLSAAALIISLGGTLWAIFQSPAKKNEIALDGYRTSNDVVVGNLRGSIDLLRREAAAECKSIDDKTDALTGRVSTIETVIQHMPDTATMQRLELHLERVSGRIDTLSVQLSSVEHLSRRLQNMMTSGGSE